MPVQPPLPAISQMHTPAPAGMPGGAKTVLEITGHDRQGLLADLMDAFATASCVVWSASIWTSKGRATLVLGVTDAKQPLSVDANWRALEACLFDVLGGAAHSASMSKDSVVWPRPTHPAAGGSLRMLPAALQAEA